MKYRNLLGTESTHWRTGRRGKTWSLRCAAVSTIRRVVHEGQTPRPYAFLLYLALGADHAARLRIDFQLVDAAVGRQQLELVEPEAVLALQLGLHHPAGVALLDLVEYLGQRLDLPGGHRGTGAVVLLALVVMVAGVQAAGGQRDHHAQQENPDCLH